MGASFILLLIHLLIRTPRSLATPTERGPRPEPIAPNAPITVKQRRRWTSMVRLFVFLVVCGALAGVPFALDAYADVKAPEIQVPSEELEPLPPSYEMAGLSETASFDAVQIMSDSAMFRATDREVRDAKRRSASRRYVLPLDRTTVTVAQLAAKHHDYPAADLGIPRGTPVFAAHAGTIETVTTNGRCGRGVIISGSDGFNYIYCHGSEVSVELGDEVKAGDTIMLSGNTGHSTGPHLHFGIETPDGTKLCPQDLLVAWFQGDQTSPEEATSAGCSYRTKTRKRGGKRLPPAEHAYETGRPKPSDPRDGGEVDRPEPRPTPTRPPRRTPSPTPSPDPDPTPGPEPSPVSPAEITSSPTP